MAPYNQMKIQYDPVTTWAGQSQNNYVGAQSVAGQRGTLPTFTNLNSYFIAKTGSDTNSGTSSAPFLTLGHLFNVTPNVTVDTSGASGSSVNPLTQNGTVPVYQWPIVPMASTEVGAVPVIPLTGSVVTGPYSDSNYLSGGAGLLSSLENLTAFTIEGSFFLSSLPNTNRASIFSFGTSGAFAVDVAVSTSGVITAFFNNGASNVAGQTVLTGGQQYYFSVVYSSGASNGTKISVGISPETLALDNTGTVTYTTPASVTRAYVGALVSATGHSFRTGYLNRVAVSTAANTTFPAKSGQSGLIGLYTFATAPLMQTAPLSYLVFQDSGTYNETIFANFRYDITSAFGIYAADGQTPTLEYQKGALTGTYGVNNASRPTPGVANYYVSKTGNDSNAGTSGSPFLTITKALTAITTGQVIQVQDSGTYIADYTAPNFNFTVQAAAGQSPVLQAVAAGSTAVHWTASGTSTAATISGFLVNGQSSQGVICGSLQSSFTFEDCTIINFGALHTATGSLTCTWERCRIISVPYFTLVDTPPGSMSDTFDKVSYTNPANQYWNLTGGNPRLSGNLTITGSTFINVYLYGVAYNSSATATIKRSLFQDCLVAFLTNNANQTVYSVDSVYFNSSLWLRQQTGVSITAFCQNNVFYGYNASAIMGVSAGDYPIGGAGLIGADTDADTNAATIFAQNCISIGYAYNFYITHVGGAGETNNTILKNCTSANATIAGYESVQTSVTLDFALDSGSATARQTSNSGAFDIEAFEANALIASGNAGSENIALLPDDPFYFAGQSAQTDGGYDWAFWYLNFGGIVTLNGLTFNTAPYVSLNAFTTSNQESAIYCISNVALNVEYCSFIALGPYGLNVPAGSSVTSSFFNTNGTGIKTNQNAVTIENNVGWECGGSLISNFGTNATIENNSAWGCAYGQYDSSWSSNTALIANIYAGSSVYDYSGYGTQTYADIVTLDPTTPAAVDSNSTRLDPLFRNTLTGDLRLQAIPFGFYFNSPAIGAGPGGADMGVFSITYGTSSTVWTTIDFSAADVAGPVTGNYRNPDTVDRSNEPIHLSEEDMENGVPYSVDSTQKLQLVLAWNQSANDMPTAQLTALYNMFNCPTNQIQIDLGGMPLVPTGYLPAYFLRKQGFGFKDIIGGYADSGVPTPLREIEIRLI